MVRQGGCVDAWARVRPRERDGDSGHTEEQEVAGKERVATERGSERAAEGREAREGWTGWIRRLAAIDFSRQTRGLFVPLLVLVLLPSDPLALSLTPSLFLSCPPPDRPRPAYPAPLPPPFLPFLLARSLFALLLVNALPPFDSRSAILSLSLFAFLSCLLSFLHAFASRDLSASFLLSFSSRISFPSFLFSALSLFHVEILKRFNSSLALTLSFSFFYFLFSFLSPSVSHILLDIFYLYMYLYFRAVRKLFIVFTFFARNSFYVHNASGRLISSAGYVITSILHYSIIYSRPCILSLPLTHSPTLFPLSTPLSQLLFLPFFRLDPFI